MTAIATDRTDTYVLAWSDEDEGPFDAARLATAALDALDALAPVVEPLAVEVALACIDDETGDALGSRPEPPGVLATLASPPAGVAIEPTYAGAEARALPALDRAALADLLRPRDDAPGCGGTAALWDEVVIDAVRAALPLELDVAPGADALALGGGRTAPLEWRGDRAHVVAPTAGVERPFRLALRRDASALRLRIEVGWSLWQVDGDGAMQLARALLALRGAGWVLEEGGR